MIILLLGILCPEAVFAQPYQPEIYRIIPENFPSVRAILSGSGNPRALIYYNNQRFNVTNFVRIDEEWVVEEIRRESVLFKRTSTLNFAEIYLNLPDKPKRHTDRSFFGQPVSMWEAVELLAYGFGYQAVMNFQAGAAILPAFHGNSIKRMMEKAIPPTHAFTVQGPVVMVFPKEPSGEKWQNIAERVRKYDAERLTLRFPGLNKSGVVNSRGEDIQFVLRKISLGSGVNISFPRDLHFPVYATLRNIPFSQILAKIVIANQCMILERENWLEICPWPGLYLHQRPDANQGYPLIHSSPLEPQNGYGPNPPPSEAGLGTASQLNNSF